MINTRTKVAVQSLTWHQFNQFKKHCSIGFLLRSGCVFQACVSDQVSTQVSQLQNAYSSPHSLCHVYWCLLHVLAEMKL